MTRSSYAAGQLHRRAARAHGRAGRLRPPCDRGDAPCYSRAWRSRAARRVRLTHPGRDAGAPLPDPLERAAEAPGAEAPARLFPLDPRPRPLPRQRVLPARVPRSRLPPDPDRAQDARGAEYSRVAPPARREAARARARDRTDRLR